MSGFSLSTNRRATNIRFFTPLMLLVAAVVLSACATLSKEECLAADWYTIGVEDGSNGRDMSRIGAHRKACAEVGVQPDIGQYTQGREQGLLSFCTYERGYSEGKRGYSYKGACPSQLEPVFMQGYLAGERIYKVNQEIRRLESELATVRAYKAEVRAGLDNGYTVDAAGKKNPLTPLERSLLYERLSSLSRDEGRLEGEIEAMRTSIYGA